MAAPLQNIADVVVLKASADEPDLEGLDQDCGAPIGPALAKARMAKGLSHADVQAGTKIKSAHIAAIEAGDQEALPATPFTAGFVKAYAQFLGLDADAFAQAYKKEAGFVPLAAPALSAMMRESARARVSAPPGGDDPRPAGSAPSSLEPALSAPRKRTGLAAGGFDGDRMVTWLGAGAAIAVAALLAGRAVQTQQNKADIKGPPSTVIAETPTAGKFPEVVATSEPTVTEPEDVAVGAADGPAAPIEASEGTLPAPEAAAPVETGVASATSTVAVKPPGVKPKPKAKPAEIDPAPLEEVTPPPVLIVSPAAESEPAIDAVPADAEAQPETPPAPPEPVIAPARMTRAASPEYPERCALRAGQKVSVTVLFSITAEGRPVSASILASDDRCFNSAAQRAVYDMRFSPRTVDGVPTVESGKSVVIQFVR
jgi:TonB family protein